MTTSVNCQTNKMKAGYPVERWGWQEVFKMQTLDKATGIERLNVKCLSYFWEYSSVHKDLLSEIA